jgi:uncharacterized protein (DUF4415 family)
MAKIEFDLLKSARNAQRRGLPFERVAEFDWEGAVVVADVRREYGERLSNMSKRKPLTNRDGDVRALTAADFRRMRPAREVLPKMVGAKVAAELFRPRGRPRKDDPKAQVTLRLDAEVVRHFKSSGPGWQTRINAVLKRAVLKIR